MKKNRNENIWSTRFQCTKSYALTFIPKVYRKTLNVLPVSLYGSRKINPNQHNASAPCTKDSILDLYAKPLQFVTDFPDVKNMSLLEFIDLINTMHQLLVLRIQFLTFMQNLSNLLQIFQM